MAWYDQSNQTNNAKKSSNETPTVPVYRSISGRQILPKKTLDGQTHGRIWNVKKKNNTQLALFILGLVVVILSIIQLKAG